MPLHCLTLLSRLIATAAVVTLLATPLAAQRYDRGDDRGYDRGRATSGPTRNVAGQFDYYTLVLSWSPTFCAENASADRDGAQCNRRDGRRYAFVLHGLWPQHERGFPEFCPVPRKPFVPQPVIDGMLDVMPSRGLVIHQYRKHGTCSGLEAEDYFGAARAMLRAIKVPQAFVAPQEARFVDVDEIIDDFIAVNPKLKRDMLAVSCGGPGSRLREVRICMTREGAPRACTRNEDQRRLCSARRVFVPPVRDAALSPDRPSQWLPGAQPGSPSRSDERRREPQGAPRDPLPMPGSRSL